MKAQEHTCKFSACFYYPLHHNGKGSIPSHGQLAGLTHQVEDATMEVLL